MHLQALKAIPKRFATLFFTHETHLRRPPSMVIPGHFVR